MAQIVKSSLRPRDGAELGAEFSAYRLDLALGVLLQNLGGSGVSLPQASNQDGSPPRGLNSHRPSRCFAHCGRTSKSCARSISRFRSIQSAMMPVARPCSCDSAGECAIAAPTAAARAACSSL
ncbi:hypothetical protein E0I74_22520 [Rhizobium laguerreae]|nr:hypothetical protein [Rhizobium laguerreae]TBX76194.1 hypothetical protein E0I74_22520 [Rhizobium laguerreae]TBY09435.1 hypothetical protein E0I94_16600 [Rhizobium laguerreae]